MAVGAGLGVLVLGGWGLDFPPFFSWHRRDAIAKAKGDIGTVVNYTIDLCMKSFWDYGLYDVEICCTSIDEYSIAPREKDITPSISLFIGSRQYMKYESFDSLLPFVTQMLYYLISSHTRYLPCRKSFRGVQFRHAVHYAEIE